MAHYRSDKKLRGRHSKLIRNEIRSMNRNRGRNYCPSEAASVARAPAVQAKTARHKVAGWWTATLILLVGFAHPGSVFPIGLMGLVATYSV